jgi:hypothetical protein
VFYQVGAARPGVTLTKLMRAAVKLGLKTRLHPRDDLATAFCQPKK